MTSRILRLRACNQEAEIALALRYCTSCPTVVELPSLLGMGVGWSSQAKPEQYITRSIEHTIGAMAKEQ